MVRRLAPSAALLAALWVAGPAHAGLFDDEEARRQIADLKGQTTERLDASSRAQIELSNQIEAINAEVAKLRGQMEVLTYELEAAQKRQKDFYIDLDTRLRKLEGPAAPGAGPPPPGAAAPLTPAVPFRRRAPGRIQTCTSTGTPTRRRGRRTAGQPRQQPTTIHA